VGTSGDAIVARSKRTRPRFASALTAGGTDGNKQLTTVTGAVLIVLLAAIGFTIPQLRQFIRMHLFVGMLLIGPVLLKMASTGYRFIRYYTGNVAYRLEGPPELILRLMGPVVVLSTVAVFATGIALLIAGPQHRDPWLLLHKVTFIAWLVFIGLHILAHLPALGRALGFGARGQAQRANATAGAAGRWIALAGALVGGLVLAVVLIPEFPAWTAHGVFLHHHRDH
jgi:hypothetical protein